MGGGTTLVEALAANRHAIGSDVSPIAAFVSKAKTTLLSKRDLNRILHWAEKIVLKDRATDRTLPSKWAALGYHKDVPWPVRKSVEIILSRLSELEKPDQSRFARGILLKTAQWAIDCREAIPSAEDFRQRFAANVRDASAGMSELLAATREFSLTKDGLPLCLCLNCSATELPNRKEVRKFPTRPKLVLTSPPYPGVHVIYHQWQVNSRRRTPAPFWIIDSLDGQPSSHYTFGYYQTHHANSTYLELAQTAFLSIRSLLDKDAIIVQLLGFAEPEEFLPKYLAMMQRTGFKEIALRTDSLGRIRRIWRDVPNRRWYADAKESISTSKEVLLVHRVD